MKAKTTKYDLLKRKENKILAKIRELEKENEARITEFEKVAKRHKLEFDFSTSDREKLLKIYDYFDKKYPVEWQGGLRCDTRGMRLLWWIEDKDADFLILHLTSTSENICFSGSTSWQIYAPTIADKAKVLSQIKIDIIKILMNKKDTAAFRSFRSCRRVFCAWEQKRKL